MLRAFECQNWRRNARATLWGIVRLVWQWFPVAANEDVPFKDITSLKWWKISCLKFSVCILTYKFHRKRLRCVYWPGITFSYPINSQLFSRTMVLVNARNPVKCFTDLQIVLCLVLYCLASLNAVWEIIDSRSTIANIIERWMQISLPFMTFIGVIIYIWSELVV